MEIRDMTTPTISVLIPAFRAARTIGRAVESVLTQTMPPDEILIIDDGSPDDVGPVLAVYGGRVRLLRKDHGGASSARNLGLDHCRGDLIAFLDADDYWEPQKLEQQRAILTRHPQVGLVGGRFYNQPPDGERVLDLTAPCELFDRVWDAPAGMTTFEIARRVWTSLVLVRREALGGRRFDPDLRTAEDVDLWVRLVRSGPVYLASEPLATAVLEAGSLSRGDAADDCRNLLTVVHRYAGLLGPGGVRRWETYAYREWAAGCLGRGQGRAAVGPAWKRWMRQPWSPEACWILCKSVALSALSPVVRGEGLGVRGEVSEIRTPHSQPLSADHRGEGRDIVRPGLNNEME
jgi:glycosyltransferase involved in cell wall biosynthesis